MIITLSREFGSGGRELGKRVSDELGIKYYDKELIAKIAENCQLDPQYVRNFLENGTSSTFVYSFGHSFCSYPMVNNDIPCKIMQEQNNVIRKIAEQDCLIVGRCADVLLKDLKPFRIFVYGELEAKIARCKKKEPEKSDKEIEKFIKNIDKSRAKLYSMYSPIPWGDKRGYDLMVNTSNIDIKTESKLIAEYIKEFFRLREGK